MRLVNLKNLGVVIGLVFAVVANAQTQTQDATNTETVNYKFLKIKN